MSLFKKTPVQLHNTPARHFFGRENRVQSFAPPAPVQPENYTAARASRPAVVVNDFDSGQTAIPDRPLFKTLTLSLATAGNQTIQLAGNMVWFMSSTNATDLVNIQHNGDCDPLPWHPGNYLVGPEYASGELVISWAAQAGATAILVVGYVDPSNVRLT